MKTITVKKSDLRHDLSVFPNFSRTGSITGMKNKYYGMDALLIKSGNYIYKVTETKDLIPTISIYIKYLNIASTRFNLSINECRDKFGLYTNRQWDELFNS